MVRKNVNPKISAGETLTREAVQTVWFAFFKGRPLADDMAEHVAAQLNILDTQSLLAHEEARSWAEAAKAAAILEEKLAEGLAVIERRAPWKPPQFPFSARDYDVLINLRDALKLMHPVQGYWLQVEDSPHRKEPSEKEERRSLWDRLSEKAESRTPAAAMHIQAWIIVRDALTEIGWGDQMPPDAEVGIGRHRDSAHMKVAAEFAKRRGSIGATPAKVAEHVREWLGEVGQARVIAAPPSL